MDTQRFDSIAKVFAARHTRRAAIGSGVGLAAAAALAPNLRHVAAQEATPADAVDDTPEVMVSTDPHPSADLPEQTTYLFVQPFAGGSWAPKEGEEGTFTLTLNGAPAQTVYFSDRPQRLFGLIPTQEFLDNLGFTPVNPPNAAIVANTESGEEQEVLVIELLNPVYDEATGTLTYDAKILADYTGEGLAHAARQQSDFTLPESFTQGGLFIDGWGSRDGCGTCYKIVNGDYVLIGDVQAVPRCGFPCTACDKDYKSRTYGKICAEAFPDKCHYGPTPDHMGVSWNCYMVGMIRDYC